MGTNTKRRPIKIQIRALPMFRAFGVDDRINFSGLYCVCLYSDGTKKDIKFPWLEYPQPEIPGTYVCKIYLDKKHSYGLETQFKFKLVDDIVTPMSIRQRQD